MGGVEFAQRMLKTLKRGRGEGPAPTAERQIERVGRMEWPEIVADAEGLLGRRWHAMAEAWGDWGRDGTIYVAVRYGRHRLADVVRAVGGMQYAAAVQAVRRFAAGLPRDAAKGRFVEAMKRRMQRRVENE